MRRTVPGKQSARFEAVRRRFEVWRSKRQGRERIPERLWSAAVDLAAAEGLASTARTLRLDYYALKKRLEAAGPCDGPVGSMQRTAAPISDASTTGRSSQDSAPTFFELPPLGPHGACACVVELEHPRGATMRIRLVGGQGPEMAAAVSRVFFGISS